MSSKATTASVRGSSRAKVVSAATALFARQGYEKTSVQEIVAAAQVTKGALYHWFPSKSDLLNSIYRELLAEQTQRLQAIASGDGPVGKRLRAAAFDLVDHINEHPDELTVWARSRQVLDQELDPDQAEAARREQREYYEIFRGLVTEGQDAGVVRPDVSATIATQMFLTSVGNLHQWFDPAGRLSRQEVCHQTTEIFLTGITAAAPGLLRTPPGA